MKPRKTKNAQKFTIGMKKKLVVLFVLVLLAFIGLGLRLINITTKNGEEYEKKVLSQQRYESITIPFRRGDILDRNGTVLARSEKVYNVILDTKLLLRDPDFLEPTLSALQSCFGLDATRMGEIRTYISNNPTSHYYVVDNKREYADVKKFQDLTDKESETYNKDIAENIQGIFFTEDYKRIYPNNTLACDAIGFTTSDNIGLNGLEKQYNSVLSGTFGREYGYLDGDLNLERTTIPAVDGNNIVTTIDGKLQTIVEKYLAEFNEENKDKAHTGNGAVDVGCIMMDVHSGEILAMASYPNYDLNNPKDPSKLLGMKGRVIDHEKKEEDEKEAEKKEAEEKEAEAAENEEDDDSEYADVTGGADEEEEKEEEEKEKEKIPTVPDYITQEKLDELSKPENYEVLLENYNALWKNFCVSDTYEPGSVSKPFTVAIGLETGSITGDEVYQCGGSMEVPGWKKPVKCHGVHGAVTIDKGIEASCNVCMMNVARATGKEKFSKFQKIFGFGLKTNIDLDGEPIATHLVHSADKMDGSDIYTYSFGQSYNCTMIEMIAGFASLINGGKYYEPHMVKKIVSSSGATIKNIEPRVLRQTISEDTSKRIIQCCNRVVTGKDGTGGSAKPIGYTIGGKTGTAETSPRDKRDYVVSFMGYAPADNPRYLIYVVVNRANAVDQADAKFATRIVNKVLQEALPYLGLEMTEELSEEDQVKYQEFMEQNGYVQKVTEESAEGEENAENADGENTSEDEQKPEGEQKTEEEKKETDE